MIKAQSCPKPQNDVYANGKMRENEDAFLVFDDKNIVAISDGAGGSGIFASDWAKTLLKNLPNTAFSNVEELNNWIGGFWEDFYNQKKQEIAQNKEIHLVDFIKNKFQEEGSCATLLAIWVLDHQCHLVAYGDSTLLLHEKQENEEGEFTEKFTFFPYHSVEKFEENPFLLNWNDTPHEQGFYQKTFSLKPNTHIYLLTDALAQYVYCGYLSKYDSQYLQKIAQKTLKISPYAQEIWLKSQEKPDFFSEILQKLQQSLQTQDDFQAFLYEQHAQKLILRDDYTCVWIVEE